MSVLCRYFFQGAYDADESALLSSADALSSSFLVSSQPTLAELRRKFPFEGRYHFRLRLASEPPPSSGYCWLDLLDENRPIAVHGNPGDIHVKVLQLSTELEKSENSAEIDVPEDRQYDEYFSRLQPKHVRSGNGNNNDGGYPGGPGGGSQDVAGVLFGVKKALAAKMKQSAMAQTIQKRSVQMWEKVISVSSTAGAGGASGNAPPTAAALAQLAKLIGIMGTPLHESNREHVEFLNRLWVSCYASQPFVLRGAPWEQLGFRSGDPIRELQAVLPLHCMVFFHEVHRNFALPIMNDQTPQSPDVYAYGPVTAQVVFMLTDVLQLKDGGCLGLERPFWRLFEDPMGFFELFCIAMRAFDQSWKMHAHKSIEIGFHLDYTADFTQELLRRGPDSVQTLVNYAYQMQNW